MTNIQTNLKVHHTDLIKIFFDANDFKGVSINKYDKEIWDKGLKLFITNSLIQITYDENDFDIASKITMMALKNYGFLNMLDDYLLKCGVRADDLSPKIEINREQEEIQ